MKKHLAALAILTVLFFGCKKSADKNLPLQGTYTGELIVRPSTYQLIPNSPTEISFNSGNFIVKAGDKPTRGSGNFKLENNLLVFSDADIYTADFDWNRILNGNYSYQIKGDSLILKKTISLCKDPAQNCLTTIYQYNLIKKNN